MKPGRPREGADPLDLQTENEALKCPIGHKLPHKGNRGECTPLYCMARKSRAQKGERAEGRKGAPSDSNATLETAITPTGRGESTSLPVEVPGDVDSSEVSEGVSKERRRMAIAAGRFSARSEFLGVPKNLEGKAAEEWSDKKLVDLLPLAVAHKEFMLKFGDDKQADKAADDILQANGRGKRDGNAAGGPAIVIVTQDGALRVPWRQEKVVGGGSTDEEK